EQRTSRRSDWRDLGQIFRNARSANSGAKGDWKPGDEYPEARQLAERMFEAKARRRGLDRWSSKWRALRNSAPQYSRWDVKGGKDSSWGWPPAFAGCCPCGRHRRPVAAQAAARPVLPVERRFHPELPDHRRLARSD